MNDIRYINRGGQNLIRIFEHVLGEYISEFSFLKSALNKGNRFYESKAENILAAREGLINNKYHVAFSYEEFLDKKKKGDIPVLGKGLAKSWECSELWSFDFFKKKCGEVEVYLVPDSLSDKIEKSISLKDLLDNVGSGCMDYARFVPILHSYPELLDSLDMEFCSSVISRKNKVKLWGEKKKGAAIRSHLFLGEKNSKTNLHCELTQNLFVNVSGKKKWYLYPPGCLFSLKAPVNRNPGVFWSEFDPESPDYIKYPLMKYVEECEINLSPGDVLYVPSFYWHSVINMTNNISLGLRWYDFMEANRSSSCLNFLSIVATNPTMLSALRDAVEYGKVHGGRS